MKRTLQRVATVCVATMGGLLLVQCGPKDGWNLIWEDDFTASTIDTTKWSKIPRGGSDWDNYMSDRADLYAIENGNLILRGIVNDRPEEDTAAYLTGGLWTKGKMNFLYGKIEIRARLESAQGAWPAFWMLCANNENGRYPKNGEIDLMEHLNYDSVVYQTIHSYYTLNLGERTNPVNGTVPRIDPSVYNTYGMEWTADSLTFLVNGLPTMTYPKIETDKEGQYPFNQPFYLLLDMQLGGSWVGAVDPATLPVKMEIDWVKIYQKHE